MIFSSPSGWNTFVAFYWSNTFFHLSMLILVLGLIVIITVFLARVFNEGAVPVTAATATSPHLLQQLNTYTGISSALFWSSASFIFRISDLFPEFLKIVGLVICTCLIDVRQERDSQFVPRDIWHGTTCFADNPTLWWPFLDNTLESQLFARFVT